MKKKKKKSKLFIFLIICFVLMPFLLTKGCNYMESLNQAENSVNEPISSISGQIQLSRVHAQAHSIRKAKWTGTAVPNSGIVDKLYLNDKLSFQKIYNLLSSIEYTQVDEIGYFSIYPVLYCNGGSKINILKFANTDTARTNEYVIVVDDEYAWNSNNDEGYTTYGLRFLEIQKQYGYIPSTGEALDKTSINNLVLDVGFQNDKLASVISITPFEQVLNELSIENLFSQLGNAVIIFGSAIVNVFISMEPVFWNEGPTLIFILLIAAVSFALIFWGIELLISLIGVFKTKRNKKK